MKLSTEDIAKALGVSPINTNANLSLNNISIDSRDPQKDNIFIAIKGEHHNGHDFIDDAFEKVINHNVDIDKALSDAAKLIKRRARR